MFNNKSRTQNSMRAGILGITKNISSMAIAFVYRTIFLMILSVEYLGLNSLFMNIFNLLSLAELGIGSVIAYRMYKPIADDDVGGVSAYMQFYKMAYMVVAGIIAILGLALMPFLKFLIKDLSEVPSDVNLYFVYALFLFQSVSSYFFSYKQSLLSADQHNDKISIFIIITKVLTNLIMITVLWITRQYILVLITSIASNIICNYIFSLIITNKYKEVFEIKKNLTKFQQKQILKDTYALMIHRIGDVVRTSTDNIIISAFIGVALLGKFDNYAMIISSIYVLSYQIISTSDSSIGNMLAKGNSQKSLQIFYQVHFVNIFVTAFCTICLFAMLDPFIQVWQGAEKKIDNISIALACLSFYVQISRVAFDTFINASGLFVKDKLRPVIEVTLNLVLSIILVKRMGLAGVFIGTIISTLCTAYWRAPYILFKYIFKTNAIKLAFRIIYITIVTIATAVGMHYLVSLMPISPLFIIVDFIVVIVGALLVLVLSTFWMQNAKDCYILSYKKLTKIFAKSKK